MPCLTKRFQTASEVLSQKYNWNKREKKRSEAQARPEKKRGELSGNGRTYKPSLRTEDKYAKALSLYKDTALTLKEIAERTHVTAEGLRSYLHKWHIDLVRERAGLSSKAEGGLDLRKSKKRMKTVAAKYEKAIGSLEKTPPPDSPRRQRVRAPSRDIQKSTCTNMNRSWQTDRVWYRPLRGNGCPDKAKKNMLKRSAVWDDHRNTERHCHPAGIEHTTV